MAAAALESGAQIVNDVSGGRADPNMAAVLADAKVPWVLMHWRSVRADAPHEVPGYTDVVSRGARGTAAQRRRRRARPASDPAKVIIDPGLGFAKTAQHNWAAAAGAAESSWTPDSRCWSGRRASASSARCWPGPTARCVPPDGRGDRDRGDLGAGRPQQGAWGVRVHDVRASVDAIKVVQAWTQWSAGRWLIESNCAA